MNTEVQVTLSAKYNTDKTKVAFDVTRIEYDAADFMEHERMLELDYNLVTTDTCQIYWRGIIGNHINPEIICDIISRKPEYKINNPYNWLHSQMFDITESILVSMANAELPELQEMQRVNNYKPGWVFYQVKDKYNYEIACKVLPKQQ
jgi:hypothetical protein